MPRRLILISLHPGERAERDLAAIAKANRKSKVVRVDFSTADGRRQKQASAGAAEPFNVDGLASRLAATLRSINLRRGDRIVFDQCAFSTLESLSEVTVQLGLQRPFDVDAFFIISPRCVAGGSADEAQISHPETIRWRLQSGSPFRRLHLLADRSEVAAIAEDRLGLPVRLLVDERANKEAIDALLGTPAVEHRRSSVKSNLTSGSVSLRLVTDGEERRPAINEACRFLEAHGLRVNSFDQRNVASIREVEESAVDLVAATLVVNALRDVDLACELDRLCTLLQVPTVRLESCSASISLHTLVTTDTALATTLLDALRALRRDLRPAPSAAGFGDRDFDLCCYSDLASPLKPSLQVDHLGLKAAVIMPMWGRCGSSYAMEAHVRFLLEQGYFVHQVLVADKEISAAEGGDYLWKMLAENSTNTRGNVQRIAHVGYGQRARTSQPLSANGLTQLLERIEGQKLNDEAFENSLRASVVTIVNHVFHVFWARRWAGGRMVLETHDIQTYQCARWPLKNEITGAPETVEAMLAAEKEIVSSLDYVVNVAPEEHEVFNAVNPKSRLVTPYLPERELTSRFASVSDMAGALGWHSTYKHVVQFDLFLVGDSHFANQEAGIWFIQDVFLPYLAHRNVKLVICGRLTQVLWEKFGPQQNIFYLGFVDDIISVRALSKLAVLIDTRGTGISIKTLETFSAGQPFVGTTISFRGLRDRLPAEIQGYDRPEEFANRVLDVLQSGFEYERLRSLARRSYQAVASKGLFDGNWSGILEEIDVAGHMNAQGATRLGIHHLPTAGSLSENWGHKFARAFKRFINI